MCHRHLSEKRGFVKRIIPPVWVAVSLMVMTGLHLYVPIREIVPSPVRFGGLVLIVLGLSLVVWPARMFARLKTTIRPFEESSALVTAGPYRVTRNPIYLGMTALLLGSAILFGSLAPFLVVPLFVALIDRVFIIGEEGMLRATFAEDYDEYCRQVRRWI